MKIRFYNARILTMEEKRPVFWGEIVVKDDQIECVIASSDRSESAIGSIRYDREIDCKGNLLMPGFKNAHTHSPMTFLRSYADDLPLQNWLHEKVFPMEAKLTEEHIYQFGRLAILEYLTAGVTGVFDMYLKPAVMAKVSAQMGMRTVLVSGLNNFTSSLRQTEEEFEQLNSYHPLVKYHLGFHAEYTTSKEILNGLTKLVQKYKAPVFTHLSETQREVEECVGRYGMTPPALLNDLGIWDYGGGGYHCLYLTKEDREIFADRGLYAVTCPASNLKLSSGIAPIAQLMKDGIPIAIGTDGPASNNCLDMFREMFLVSGLSKYRENDAASLDASEVLKMATVNGARAMGLADSDILAPGKQADMIMIDLRQPNMQPIHNIEKNLVYSGSKSNIKMTMIAGKILYMDGEFFVGAAPEEIYETCKECLKELCT